MKNLLFTIAILSFGLLSFGQESNFSLVAAMNGSVDLDGGGSTNVWGYKYEGPGVVTIPAPFLNVMADDSVHVTFTNISPESHTIHWHGLDVDQLNDGVPSTSFYVLIGETVTYSFKAPHPGVYIYHCHVLTTIHLTMGMYGMFVVQYPGNKIYENGPGYNREYQFLSSDMDIEANDDPVEAYPFHTIKPDYFMINGKSGDLLLDDDFSTLTVHEGDSVALRLGNIAYSKTEYIFPEGANAVVHLSDGREIPEPFETDTLVVGSGERFTVMLYPDENFNENVIVNFYSMVNKQLVGTNEIEVVNLGTPGFVDEFSENSAILFPNPANDLINIEIANEGWYDLIDVNGNLIERKYFNEGTNSLDINSLNSGHYFISGNNQKYRFIKK